MPTMSDLVAREASRQLRKRLDQLDLSSLTDRVDLSVLAERIPKQVLLESPVVRDMEDRAANRGFVGGFLIGAVVGAVLALIFAPRRGAETRDLIAHTVSDVTEKVSSVVGVGDTREDAFANLKEKAVARAEQVSAAIDDAKEAVKDATAEVQDEAAEQASDADSSSDDLSGEIDSKPA
ncbi:MAG: YtxH domain-containing protein [Thermomicrobiales bacterium]